MKIDVTECNGAGVGLFADFAKYETVDRYLQAVLDVAAGRVEYMTPNAPKTFPLNCAVKDLKRGKYRWIVQYGQPHPDSEKNMRWLKRQNAHTRSLMSDDVVVKGDAFERELFFSWN